MVGMSRQRTVRRQEELISEFNPSEGYRMKRIPTFRSGLIAILIVTLAGSIAAQKGDVSKAGESDANKLVYADFQSLHNGRPVSKRGGLTRLNKYAQNMANAPRVRGLEN